MSKSNKTASERWVFNHNNEIISAKDLEKGVAKSGNYTCIYCKNKMTYVDSYIKQDKIKVGCYFRHNAETCLNKDTPAQREQYRENKMSDFHKTWQNLFPVKNREIRTKIGPNKYLIADIVIDNTKSFNLKNENNDVLDEPCKKLTIEIQHSPIDKKNLKKRDTNYRGKDKNLLWIFDIKGYTTIEKIVLFTGSFYRIKLSGKHYFPEMFSWDNKVNIMLDNGSEWIYHVVGSPKLDVEYVEAMRISRIDLLKQFAMVLGPSELGSWEGEICKIDCPIYDYDETETSEQVRYVFYLMEKLPRKYFNVGYLCNMLSKMSKGSEYVRECLLKWVKRYDYADDRNYADDLLIDQYSRIYSGDDDSGDDDGLFSDDDGMIHHRADVDDEFAAQYLRKTRQERIDKMRCDKIFILSQFAKPCIMDNCFDMMIYLAVEYKKINKNITYKMSNDKKISCTDDLMNKCNFIKNNMRLFTNTSSDLCVFCSCGNDNVYVGNNRYRTCYKCFYDIDSIERYKTHKEYIRLLDKIKTSTKQYVSIKDALKLWIGDKYDANDYKIFKKMKKINCPSIFLDWHIPGGGGLIGNAEHVNLENETVDRVYFQNLLENMLKKKYKPGVRQIRKIKNVSNDEADDIMLPYGDDLNVIAISVCDA